MDRTLKTGRSAPRIALAVSTALAGLALAGCATSAAPRADVSFANAQAALQKGNVGKAVAHAEAAVLADPRNANARALLGAAYLESGRFQSAATSFDDALQLGNTDPRTVLSYALAKTAIGQGKAAAVMLADYEPMLDPADFGLALALAGKPERGVHVLTNAVRNGEASPKLRQNLAYAYALSGNWRAARVMAAEDVPADQLDARLTEWAANAAPENVTQRVAMLLGVAPVADAGQPARLALANFPSQETLFAEAAAQAPVIPSAPVAMPDKAPVAAASTASFAQAFDGPGTIDKADPSVATLAPRSTAPAAPRYVSNPVVQSLPGTASRAAPQAAAPAPAPARIAATATQRRMEATAAPVPASGAKADGTHLVQLGAFSSKAEAERGWTMIKGKFPQLSNHDLVITEAVVNGRTFWRVAAAGFGQSDARSMCSTVKSAGRGCFAYAASSPPKGAVDRGVRVAARGR